MGGAACKKIIINGGLILKVVGDVHEAALKAEAAGEYLKNDTEIIKLFNAMENMAFQAQRLYLEGQGFQGPWPHSMDFNTEPQR